MKQTGLSDDSAARYILPLLASNTEGLKRLETMVTDLYMPQQQTTFFLDRLCDGIKNSHNPENVFAYLYGATANDKGELAEGVRNSPALGPMIQLFQSNIPAEIKNSIPESKLLFFMNATLARMVSSEKGKKATIDVLHRLSPDADLAKISQETGFDRLMFQESLNELSSRPHWKEYYEKFQNTVSGKDSTKGSESKTPPNRPVEQTEKPAAPKEATPREMETHPQPTAPAQGISARLAAQGKETAPHTPPIKPLDNSVMQAATKKYSHVA